VKTVFNVTSLSSGPKNHFYGYYGINPWDPSVRYHLALETDFHERRPEQGDSAAVGLVDRQTHAFTPYAKTSAFNLQQGSMMHWIDGGFGPEFTFNDWEDGELVSRAVNPDTGKMRTIQGAIAAVSPTEPIAMGLNYARMAHCRPVVGYANNMNPASLQDHPDDDGLSLIDLKSGESRLVLSIAHVVKASRCEEVQDRRAWFNHVLFNTDGTRILFFCRVNRQGGLYTSLWTVNPDGSHLECQIPFRSWISHFAWRDPERILISCNLLGDGGFLEFTDGRRDFRPFGEGVLPRDGHACFSPDGRWIVCDHRIRKEDGRFAELMLYCVDDNTKITLGEFYYAEHFKGDIRCDLHPRWSPDGRTISFDSVHEGFRQVYAVDVSEQVRKRI
jgi:hypothetical protein